MKRLKIDEETLKQLILINNKIKSVKDKDGNIDFNSLNLDRKTFEKLKMINDLLRESNHEEDSIDLSGVRLDNLISNENIDDKFGINNLRLKGAYLSDFNNLKDHHRSR